MTEQQFETSWIGEFCMACYRAGYRFCVKQIPQDQLPFEKGE